MQRGIPIQSYPCYAIIISLLFFFLSISETPRLHIREKPVKKEWPYLIELCVITNVMDADIHPVLHLLLMLGFRHVAIADGIHAHGRHFRVSHGPGGNDLALRVQLHAVGGNLEVPFAGVSMRNSLLGLVHCLDLAAFAPDLLQVVEVAFRNGGDVFAAEDTDFEVLRFGKAIFACNLGAGTFQALQGLVDDLFGADVTRDTMNVSVVRNQFAGRSQVDTVDMGMSVRSQFRASLQRRKDTYVISGEQLAK